MSRRGGTFRLAVALSVAAPGCAGPSDDPVLAQAASRCEPPAMVAELPSPLLEASGVARDPRSADVFWAHNDSGNPAELFAVDGAGRLLATVPVRGARNRDWEDIAVGPCPAGSCLYLADIGDNLAVHSSIVVHRLPLPELSSDTLASAAVESVDPETSWRLVYPDGPRDAETLAIDGEGGELIVVTKGREGVVELYTLLLGELRSGTGTSDPPNALRRVGSLRVPIGDGTGQLVTGGDLSPDGTRLVIRSYTTLFEFPWQGAAQFDTLVAPATSSLIGALEAQGEGVAWELSGESLVMVSEGRGGRPPTFSRIRCPAPGE